MAFDQPGVAFGSWSGRDSLTTSTKQDRNLVRNDWDQFISDGKDDILPIKKGSLLDLLDWANRNVPKL